jgi:hypothetical protein
VHGGDGFAFVIQGHPNTTSTIGSTGQGMGWHGVTNSIAVVFDTWPNPNMNDLFVDHIQIYLHAASNDDPAAVIPLSIPTPVDLADGMIHAVKIRYYNTLPLEYFSYFSATADLPTFLKDISESRRVGCLLVFMDDGIRDNVPVLAIPINLAVALRLDRDTGYVVWRNEFIIYTLE